MFLHLYAMKPNYNTYLCKYMVMSFNTQLVSIFVPKTLFITMALGSVLHVVVKSFVLLATVSWCPLCTS